MELIRFIRKHKYWLSELSKEPYNIQITYKPPYYHLYCPYPTTTLQHETNGIVLNEENEIVCYGFNSACSLLKLNKNGRRPQVTQFVDGFWFWVWNDGRRWHYTTPTYFDAYEQPITNQTSFGTYIEELAGGSLTNYLTPTFTYMFQLVENKVWYFGKRSMQSLDFEDGIPPFIEGCAPIHVFSSGMWDSILFAHIEKASTTELGCTFWNDELWANKPYAHYKPRKFNMMEVVNKYFNGEKIEGFARPLVDEIDIYLHTLEEAYNKVHARTTTKFKLILTKLNEPLKSIFREMDELNIDVYEYYKKNKAQLIKNANLNFYLY